MLANKNMQESIGFILFIGTFVSVCIAMVGGSLYLIQHGNETLSTQILQSDSYHLSIFAIWQSAKSLSSVGMIELGLLSLVMTQIVRVATLVWFYLKTHDYVFPGISLFILLTL